MKRTILTTFLLLISFNSISAPLTYEQTEDFAKPYEIKCLESTSQDPRTRNFSVNRLREYCECSSEYITDRLTQADVKIVEEEGDVRKIIELSIEANKHCAIKELT